ncbi:hypothetical protein GO011_21485 [Mycobacterium sp. 20091114027_K0903767]|nr:hypothetical protein [Mycobacterium sp. 20091114027_K0903767]
MTLRAITLMNVANICSPLCMIREDLSRILKRSLKGLEEFVLRTTTNSMSRYLWSGSCERPTLMSGALKHFFDTVYYPSLDHVAGRPYGLWVHGNNDTVGAANAVDKIVTGLALVKAADVLEVAGVVDAGARERAYELGGTLAAILME